MKQYTKLQVVTAIIAGPTGVIATDSDDSHLIQPSRDAQLY